MKRKGLLIKLLIFSLLTLISLNSIAGTIIHTNETIYSNCNVEVKGNGTLTGNINMSGGTSNLISTNIYYERCEFTGTSVWYWPSIPTNVHAKKRIDVNTTSTITMWPSYISLSSTFTIPTNGLAVIIADKPYGSSNWWIKGITSTN
jgi:hypothetical protein